jgi:hypothetical protein
LISGWFSLILRWSEVLQIVSKETQVVYIETRDKTSSIVEKSKQTDMSIERMSLDIAEVSGELGIDFQESICLASSMAATIMLKYLGDQNIAPWKTILLGPVPKFKFPPLLGSLLLAIPTFLVGFGMRYVRWHVLKFRVDKEKEPEQAKSYDLSLKLADPWKIRYSAKAAKRYNGWDDLEKINANVILVGASADKLHASEVTQKISSMIKGSEYVDFQTNQAAHSREMGVYLLNLIDAQE